MATLAKAPEINAVQPGKPGRKRNPFNFAGSKQKFREPSIFADFVRAYPDHQATVCYFYRLRPVIDVSLIGDTETCIGKTHTLSDMAEEFAADKWGRGKYWVCFNDENRPQGHQNVAQTWFDITDPTVKPPVYDLRTLVLSEKENIDEINRAIAAGKIERDQRGNYRLVGQDTQTAAVPAVTAPVAVAAPQPSAFGSIGDRVVEKLLDRALPSATPLSPSDTLEQAFQIADRLKPPNTGEAAMFAELRNELRALQTKFENGGPGSQLDRDLAAYERMETFFDKIGAGRARTLVGSEEPAWLKPLVAIAEKFAPLVLSRLATPPAAHTAPHNASPHSGPVALAAGAPAPPMTSYPVFLPADAPLMDRAIQVVSLALEKFNQGVSGFDFAAWMVGFYPGGREVFKMLESAGGPAECIGLIAMFPQLHQVAGPVLADPVRKEALEQWLADFLDYNADVEGAAEESADEAARPAA
jgi:hypothetical protein